jgi:hypothetical protein
MMMRKGKERKGGGIKCIQGEGNTPAFFSGLAFIAAALGLCGKSILVASRWVRWIYVGTKLMKWHCIECI